MRQKRFLSWIMVFALIIGMITVPAYAEETTTMISGDGTAVKTGTMTITLSIPAASVKTAPTANTGLKYNGSAQELVTAGEAENGTMKYAAGENGTTAPTDGWSSTIPTGTDAGTYYVWYRVASDHGSTEAVCLDAIEIAADTYAMTITLVIKSGQTITASDMTVTYGDTGKSVSASVTDPSTGGGALSYAVKSGDAVTVDESTGALTIQKVGTAVITVTAAETSTYASAAKDVTVTVNKADPTVTAPTAKTLTYTGSALELVNAGSTEDGTMYYALGTDATTAPADSAYTTSIPTATNAGTYYVWYKVTGDSNHNDAAAKSVTASIAKKDLSSASVTLDNIQLTYNGSEQTVNVTGVSLDGAALSASDYIVSGNTGKDKGDYTVTVTGKGNYTGSATAPWKIVAKAMTVTAENVKKTYDGSSYGITVNVTDPSSGTTIKYGTTEGTYDKDENPEFKDAGTHDVYFQVTGSSNYEVYTGYATVTISKKDVSASVTAESKVYDGTTEAAVSASVSSSDIVSGDSIEITGLAGTFADKNAGTDKVVTVDRSSAAISGTGSSNYEVSIPASTTADITKAALTITANDNTISYGAAPAGNGVTCAGLADGDSEEDLGGTLAYSFSYEKNGKPGKYTITPSGLTSDNYEIEFVDGKLTVESKVSVVAAKGIAKGKAKVKLTWNKVDGAASYEVWFARCNSGNKKYSLKKVKTLGASATSFTKKSLKKNTAYKFYVIAKDSSGNVISKSRLGRTITGNVRGKYTNAKKLKVSKASFTLSKGGTAKIKATQTKARKSRKLYKPESTALLRYRSDNKAVATVDANGKITAVGTGWCRIYVQTVNGICKTVEVTVK